MACAGAGGGVCDALTLAGDDARVDCLEVFAAIGAAGMYVELILATIATFIWWYAEPGWIQDLSLQIMLVCSVSTVLFNGNPLLRFDGYYILSDLLEIPNLYQKSTKDRRIY